MDSLLPNAFRNIRKNETKRDQGLANESVSLSFEARILEDKISVTPTFTFCQSNCDQTEDFKSPIELQATSLMNFSS